MNDLPNLGEVLRFYARIVPDKIGARDLERAMTFREWNARSCRLAHALLGLGLAKGDRVAVLAYNCEAAAFIVQDDLVGAVEQVRPDLAVPARNFIHFGAAKYPPGYRAYEELL